MKSIKPGRGPSMMGAVGSAVAIIFGIFWTFTAFSMQAPVFFPIFGVIFIIIGIVQLLYNIKNASGKNRFSVYDITDSNEESDPLDNFINRQDSQDFEIDENHSSDIAFCPYCGTKIKVDFIYCKKCGKKLR